MSTKWAGVNIIHVCHIYYWFSHEVSQVTQALRSYLMFILTWLQTSAVYYKICSTMNTHYREKTCKAILFHLLVQRLFLLLYVESWAVSSITKRVQNARNGSYQDSKWNNRKRHCTSRWNNIVLQVLFLYKIFMDRANSRSHTKSYNIPRLLKAMYISGWIFQKVLAEIVQKGLILSQKVLISNRRNFGSFAPKSMRFPSKDNKSKDLST